jgi:hypothetical protein
MGIGDWGLGIGDWGLGQIPNPQSPIPIRYKTYLLSEIFIYFQQHFKKYKYILYLMVISI